MDSDLRNLIIKNFKQGIYVNTRTQARETLNKRLNKHNMELLGRLNESVNNLSVAIVLGCATKSILETCENIQFKDIRIVCKLVQSYGIAVSISSGIRTGLKTYGVTKQQVYDAISAQIDMQNDRCKRTTALMIGMYEKLGLTCLIKAVEDELNVDFMTSIQNHVNNHVGEDFSLQGETYSIWLKTLASQKGIDTNSIISNGIKAYHEQRENKDRLEAESEKIQKAMEQKITAQQAITENNVNIQHNMETWYLHRECDTGAKLSNIVAGNGGIIYYIAVCKKTRVKYI